MSKKIILIGYMGCGKSSVALNLANNLNLKSTDLDGHIENITQLTISEIFKLKGEIQFRKLEAEQLKKLLGKSGDWVLSLGGGTPCYGNNMDLIAGSEGITSIYLQVGLDTLTERLFPERHKRPLISHLETPEILRDFISKHLFERSFYYNRATKIIQTENKSISEISKEIIKGLF